MFGYAVEHATFGNPCYIKGTPVRTSYIDCTLFENSCQGYFPLPSLADLSPEFPA